VDDARSQSCVTLSLRNYHVLDLGDAGSAEAAVL
jgi:hypothetical protein